MNRGKWKGVVQKLMYGAEWCATKSSVHFFTEQSISENVYLDLLTEYFVQQSDHLQPDIVFEQDGDPLHWGLDFFIWG